MLVLHNYNYFPSMSFSTFATGLIWKVKKKFINVAQMEFILCLSQVSCAENLRRASPSGNEGTLQASAPNCALLWNKYTRIMLQGQHTLLFYWIRLLFALRTSTKCWKHLVHVDKTASHFIAFMVQISHFTRIQKCYTGF